MPSGEAPSGPQQPFNQEMGNSWPIPEVMSPRAVLDHHSAGNRTKTENILKTSTILMIKKKKTSSQTSCALKRHHASYTGPI